MHYHIGSRTEVSQHLNIHCGFRSSVAESELKCRFYGDRVITIV